MNNSLPSFRAVSGGSLAANLASAPINIGWLSLQSVHLIWTGNAVGTFAIQVSNHPNPGTTSGNWATIPFDPTPAAAGSSSYTFLNMDHLRAAWMRIVYTSTSGTGTLNAYYSGINV